MKIFKTFVALALVVFVMAGCNNSSLSDLSIVEAVCIDSANNKTTLSLQYLNLEKSSGTSDTLVSGITSIASATNNTIENAISDISTALPNKLFFGQNKLLVFGKDFFKQDFDESLDYLTRSVDARPDVLVAISSSGAKDVVKANEKSSRVPAQSVYELITNGENNGVSVAVTVSDFLNAYDDDLVDAYLPVLSVENDNVVCSGIAIFSNKKYATTLNSLQTLGFLLMQNKANDGVISVNDSSMKNIVCQIISSKAKNKMQVENGKMVFNCSIKVNIMLNEIGYGISSAVNENQIKTIESLVNKKIKSICKSTFNACVSNKSDVLMLSKYLAKADNSAYNQLKSNFKNNLPNIEFKISVKSNIQKINDSMYR